MKVLTFSNSGANISSAVRSLMKLDSVENAQMETNAKPTIQLVIQTFFQSPGT